MEKLGKFLTYGITDVLSTNVGLIALRLLFFTSLSINHGFGTLSGFIEGSNEFPDPLGLGSQASMLLIIVAEFFCALLAVVGLGTRIALIPTIIGFAVAFFVYHAGDPFGHKELAYLYLSASLTLFLLGPGKYSLDHHFFYKSVRVDN